MYETDGSAVAVLWFCNLASKKLRLLKLPQQTARAAARAAMGGLLCSAMVIVDHKAEPQGSVLWLLFAEGLDDVLTSQKLQQRPCTSLPL